MVPVTVVTDLLLSPRLIHEFSMQFPWCSLGDKQPPQQSHGNQDLTIGAEVLAFVSFVASLYLAV